MNVSHSERPTASWRLTPINIVYPCTCAALSAVYGRSSASFPAAATLGLTLLHSYSYQEPWPVASLHPHHLKCLLGRSTLVVGMSSGIVILAKSCWNELSLWLGLDAGFNGDSGAYIRPRCFSSSSSSNISSWPLNFGTRYRQCYLSKVLVRLRCWIQCV